MINTTNTTNTTTTTPTNLNENNNTSLLLDNSSEDYLHPEFMENLEKETSSLTNSLNNELKKLEHKSTNFITNTNIQRNLFSLLNSNSLDSIQRVDYERDNLRLIENEFNLLLKKKRMDQNSIIEHNKDLKRRKKKFILKLVDLETKQKELFHNIDTIKNNTYSNILTNFLAEYKDYHSDIINDFNTQSLELNLDDKYSSSHNYLSGGYKSLKKNKCIYTNKKKIEKKKTNKKNKKNKKNKITQYGKGLEKKEKLEIIADKIIDLNTYLEDNKSIIQKEKSWVNNDSIIIKLRKVNEKLKETSHNLGVQQNILSLYNIQLIKQINKEKEFKKNILENKKKLIDKINEEEKEKDEIIDKLKFEIIELDTEIEKYKDLNITKLMNEFIKFYYGIFRIYFYAKCINIIKIIYNFDDAKAIDLYINLRNINGMSISDTLETIYNEQYKDEIFIFLEKMLEFQTLLQNTLSNNILIECILKGFCFFLMNDRFYMTYYLGMPAKNAHIKSKLEGIIEKYFNLYKSSIYIYKMFPFIFS